MSEYTDKCLDCAEEINFRCLPRIVELDEKKAAEIIAKHFPASDKVTDQELYWIEQAVDISVQAGNKQVGVYVWPAIEKLKKQLGLA